MLEYFTAKKIKKHQAEKRAQEHAQSPLLNEEDENFLERIVSAERSPPPLPERRQHGEWVETGDSTDNASQMVVHDGNQNGQRVKTAEEKEEDDLNAAIAASLADSKHQHHKDKGKGKENENEKDAKRAKRFSFLTRTLTRKDKKHLSPTTDVPPTEAASEEDDITRVLNDLNLAAVNNRAFSISKESQELVQKFTVILKDLINGVPTAYDDLTHLLDDSQGTLAKSYDHLPSFLKKLVTQLPDKLTKNLAPELLAVAAEAQAFGQGGRTGTSSSKGGLTGAAKNFLKPTSLKDLVAKPGAVVSLLKTIMNALKLRWPAFMGTNVLLSLALFVLLFVFWYCHKRGREVRLAKEQTVDSNGRIVDLDDDPMLENSRPGASRSQTDRSQRHSDRPSSGRAESGRSNHRDSSGLARAETERPSHRRDRDRVEPERRPTSSRQTTSSRGSEREKGRRSRSAEYREKEKEKEREREMRSNERR